MQVHLNVVCLSVVIAFSSARIFIDPDGGYKNVVVGINPKVLESQVESLLVQLEVLFKNASKILQEATKDKVFFKEILFALPKKFENSLKFRHVEKRNEYLKKPDVLVTSDDVFQRAYTLQNDGCGKPGLRIHIPHEFLFKPFLSKGKDLVRAWAKYRYGIFDESGFSGDDLYPACHTIPGTNVTTVTDCTNHKAHYDYRMSDAECIPVPKYGENNAVVSSLMSNMDFPNMKLFCDEVSHQRDVLSKQNNLCEEKSSWKVLAQHPDFQFKRSLSLSRDAAFRYVVESGHNLVFLVDTSIKMALNDRLDVVRNAFSYFVLNTVSENDRVALINLGSLEESPLVVEVTSATMAERLIDAFPEIDELTSVCVQCGIEKALQVLQKNAPFSNGEIILATTTDIEPAFSEKLRQKLSESAVSLHVAYFEEKLKRPPQLQKMSESSGGGFFYIAEQVDTESSLAQLYEALRSMWASLSWMKDRHVLVKQSTFRYSDCLSCSLPISLDQSLETVQVLLTGPDFLRGPPLLKNRILLSKDERNFSLGDPVLAYKIKIPAYVFTLHKPQTGLWQLSFQRKSDHRKPIVVLVRGFSSNDVVRMKTRIQYNWNANEEFHLKPPFTLFTEVKRGNAAVAKVKTTASLYHAHTGLRISLSLFDHGDGDPDITRNDGIFSRYIVNLPTAGYYMLSVKTESAEFQESSEQHAPAEKAGYCCGSSYPDSGVVEPNHVERCESVGSIYVEDRHIGVFLPPRSIRDFRVEQLVVLENGITCFAFQWTAPGDNHDYLTAKDYNMRVFKSKEDAVKNFDSAYLQEITEWNIHGSILIPHPPGSMERAIVELKNLSTGYYHLAIRTVGQSGQTSGVSNVVQIFYSQPVIPSTPYIVTTTDELNTKLPGGDPSSGTAVALSVSAAIFFLLILFGVLLFFYLRTKRRKKSKPEATSEERGDKEAVSVISPVHSWPANSLLSHYESQRDIKPDVCDIPMAHKTDSLSSASTKYSYQVKYHTNPLLYDSSYLERDVLNYPFNPNFEPFSPNYTSSLRHFHSQSHLDPFHHQASSREFLPINPPCCSTLDARPIRRLRTDV